MEVLFYVALKNAKRTYTTVSQSLPQVTTSAANIAAILANPAGHYFNVHTALNGGGAIRGQLQ